MDMDLGAGGDSSSTRRKMDASSEAVEITPLEMYDSARAKIAANLHWLFAKAYGIGEDFVHVYTRRGSGEQREESYSALPEQNALECV